MSPAEIIELTIAEHVRQIDAIFGDDVPAMCHMENQEEIKEA